MKILAPHFSCVVSSFEGEDPKTSELQQALDQGYSQIYVQTPTGILKHHVLRPGKDGAARYVRLPVKEIPGVKSFDIQPDLQFLPDGRIPEDLLDEVKAFFKAVIKAKGTAVEAMIWVLWSQEKGYYLHVPNQVVAHASAQYDWQGLPADSSIIVDIHSHANFGAFFSGTDNHDDNNSIRFSGVIGDNDKPNVTTKWRFNYFGTKIDIESNVIFERKTAAPETVPQAWLDSVQIRQYTGPNYTGGRQRMDGTLTVPKGKQGQSQVRHAFYPSDEEMEELEQSFGKNKGGNAGPGKKKHFGQQGTASGSQHDMFQGQRPGQEQGQGQEGIPTVKDLISINGENFLKTPSGLVRVPGRTSDSVSQSRAYPGHEEGDPEGPGNVVDALEKAFLGEHISDAAEDRLHAAGRRQAQEDILSDQAEEFMGAMTSNSSIQISNEDLPPEFDEIAVNHGIDVAKAYAAIEIASTDLVGANAVLDRAVENLFQLVEEDRKINVFRALAQLLPTKALQSLAQNGL